MQVIPRVFLTFFGLATLLCGSSVRADSIDFGTTAGLGGLVQSISATRHVFQPDPEDSNPFLKKKAEQDTLHPRIPKPYPVAWNIGYAYELSWTGETTTDQSTKNHTHVYTGGLDWDPLPVLSFQGGFVIDYSPSEDYKAGMLELHTGYLFFLNERIKKKKNPDDDFAKSTQALEPTDPDFDEETEPDVDGPSILARLNLFAMKHIKQASPYRKRASTVLLSGPQDVYEGGIGLEAIFSPFPGLSLRGAATAFHYGGSLTPILSSLEQSVERQQLGATLLGLPGYASYLQAFPVFVSELGVNYELSSLWDGGFFVAHTVFESDTMPSIFTFQANVLRSITHRWSAGATAYFSIGTGLTTFAGTVNASYRIGTL